MKIWHRFKGKNWCLSYKITAKFCIEPPVWLRGGLFYIILARLGIRSYAHFWWVTWANRLRLLIFGERPEQIARFLWANDQFAKKTSDLLIRSFIMSTLSESLTLLVAHLSWETWAIRSRLLICHERPERFTHSRSFVLGNLSESPSHSFELSDLSEYANSQPWGDEG